MMLSWVSTGQSPALGWCVPRLALLRLMLTEWAESGARAHTLGRTRGPRPRGVPGLYWITLQNWSPGLRGFFSRPGSLATETEASQGHQIFQFKNFQIQNSKL